MPYYRNNHVLKIYHESKTSRLFIGTLAYLPKACQFELTYNKHYLQLASAIPIGPELPLTKERHLSEKNNLFPSFLDRIPSRDNPAYPEYCQSQGIAEDEQDPIVLLGTIGRRGPSTIVFEAVYELPEDLIQQVKQFREQFALSQNEFGLLLGLNKLMVYKLEAGKSHDQNSLRLIYQFLNFPDVALAQLQVTGGAIHSNKRTTIYRYFRQKCGK